MNCFWVGKTIHFPLIALTLTQHQSSLVRYISPSLVLLLAELLANVHEKYLSLMCLMSSVLYVEVKGRTLGVLPNQ